MKYNDYEWDELPMEAKAAATNLGYTKEIWDSGQETSCCDDSWDKLNKVQQDAATVLGYNQTSWNSYKTVYRLSIRFSVLCFLLGSVLYFRLSFLNLEWEKYVRDHVPETLVGVDDDAIWSQWAAEHDAPDMLEVRNTYYQQYKLFHKLAVSALVFMGLSEVFRERLFANLILVVAGFAGMAGAYSSTEHDAAVWSCISVHLYLLSCYNSNSKLFRAGCILECILSYLSLAGHTACWMSYTNVLASSLWLYCALEEVALVFEFGFSFQKDGDSTKQGLLVEIMYSLINASTLKMKRA